MSAAKEEEGTNMMFCEGIMLRCAGCGVKEDDGIKLKRCTACYLVRYCSVKCQKDHRPQHKKACKKRAAELRDEILFKQPESTHLGDCPICCLPLPLVLGESTMYTCCSKSICDGCAYANTLSNRNDVGKVFSCPFCRTSMEGEDEEENHRRKMKRIEANDPATMIHVGTTKHYRNGDYKGAFELWTKAADLGDAEAHYKLACLYAKGEGVEKDEKKYVNHSEKAAIGGHPIARHNLAQIEAKHGRLDRAVKHWTIASNLGYDYSLEVLRENFRRGLVSEEEFEAALRGNQAANDATKSWEREEVKKVFRK